MQCDVVLEGPLWIHKRNPIAALLLEPILSCGGHNDDHKFYIHVCHYAYLCIPYNHMNDNDQSLPLRFPYLTCYFPPVSFDDKSASLSVSA